ncbi:hypothetical protein CK203_038281 [Vitis vinifera]|uniref:Reverse transcriptase domain-containing protein n=1 Tax=Vitis vinifera TaxID=29760 RepID=A0A438IBN8_VITVI|nr:hypothetical protein CK203_038281 [Vitis vinifera]
MLHKNVECYVDDLVVKSRKREDHLRDLYVVFDRLRRKMSHLFGMKLVIMPVKALGGNLLLKFKEGGTLLGREEEILSGAARIGGFFAEKHSRSKKRKKERLQPRPSRAKVEDEHSSVLILVLDMLAKAYVRIDMGVTPMFGKQSQVLAQALNAPKFWNCYHNMGSREDCPSGLSAVYAPIKSGYCNTDLKVHTGIRDVAPPDPNIPRDVVSGNLITPGYLHERKSEEHGGGRNPYIRRREKKQRTRIERREIDGQIQVWEQIPRFKKGVVTGNLAIGEEIMQPHFVKAKRYNMGSSDREEKIFKSMNSMNPLSPSLTSTSSDSALGSNGNSSCSSRRRAAMANKGNGGDCLKCRQCMRSDRRSVVPCT